VFGSLIERDRKNFTIYIRSGREQKKADLGAPATVIGDFEGAATTGWHTTVAAPNAGTYIVEFSALGDLTGREVQATLRRVTDGPPAG
jgi:hypothetical protein